MNKFTAIILAYFSFFAEAKSVLKLDGKSDEYNPAGHIGFFEDKSQSIDLEQVKYKNFELSNKSNFALGYSNSNFWFKNEIINASNSKETYLVSIEIPLLSRVHFYLYDSNQNLVKKLITGCETPFNTREDKIRSFVFSFESNPNQSFILYTLVHNDFGTTNVPFRWYKKSAFMQFYEQETFFLHLFQALLIISFIITLALFINFKDKVYLYYGVYILAVYFSRLTIFGFLFKYIHPENPEFVPISKIVFILIMAISFINFVPLMLSTQKIYFPKTKKFFYYQSILYFALFLYTLSPLRGLLPVKISSFLINLMNFNFALSIIMILYMVYNSIKQNYSPAKYFAIAITPLLLIMIYLMLNNYSVINLTSLVYRYPFEIGFSLEIILLFVALINRYKYVLVEQKLEFEGKLKYLETQIQKTSEPTEKYQNSKYSLAEIAENHKLLRNYMQLNKPYLNTEINLTSLAEQLNIHHNLLSQVINQMENKNFFDYINTYRIEEAKLMLRSPKFNSFSVEGIGYECGFNTKATFYATFKKLTGFSPAEFKKAEMADF